MPDFSGARSAADRVWKLKNGTFRFRCQKKNHAEVSQIHVTLSDAEEARDQHDEKYHTSKKKAVAAARNTRRQTLAIAYLEFKASVDYDLLDDGTKADYDACYRRLMEYEPFAQLEFSSILLEFANKYVEQRLNGTVLRNGTGAKTNGGRVLKELYFLERLAQVNGVSTLPWSVRQHFQKRLERRILKKRDEVPYVAAEQVQIFLDNLNGNAFVFALLKWLTGLRSVELAEVRVRDIHLDDDDAYIEFVPHKKGVIDPGRDYRSLGKQHLEIVKTYVRGKHPDAWMFPNKSGSHADKSTFKKAFRPAALKAGIFHMEDGVPNPKKPYSAINWMRHSRATLLESADDDAAFSAEARLAAARAAAASIGTSLRTFAAHYRRKKLEGQGGWRREAEQKKRDATLIETTVTAKPEQALGVRGRASRTANILRVLNAKPTASFKPTEVARQVGCTTELEIQSYRSLMAVLAKERRILRTGRGEYRMVT